MPSFSPPAVDVGSFMYFTPFPSSCIRPLSPRSRRASLRVSRGSLRQRRRFGGEKRVSSGKAGVHPADAILVFVPAPSKLSCVW